MPSNSDPELVSMDVARKLVTTLQSAGVRDVVICPGSRSAPLAYALAESEAAGTLRLHVRIDERVAGFTALGLSLAGGAPVPVVTTSGTGVGELLPAVMEANHVGAQLLVLSADRPTELHGTGANQATNQVDLFGVHVRASVDIEAGADPAVPVAKALKMARGSSTAAPGPVQINVAFRDPLVPSDEDGLPAFGANVTHSPVGVDIAESVDWARPGSGAPLRTVVVAGHGAGPVAADFAHALGLPLFAEPSSNARFGPNAVGPYRTLLARHMSHIQRVVLFGRPTLSRPVARLLNNASIETALWTPAPAPWFEEGKRREKLISKASELEAFAGTAPVGWLASWQKLAISATNAIQQGIEGYGGLNGPLVAQEVWGTVRGNLVFGSSNVIRDADLCGTPADKSAAHVYANRGLAGIDGTIATATGIAQTRAGLKTTVLLGDVTFLHDVGGLLLGLGEPEPEMDVIVLNDGGGAIFSTLEHGAVEESGRYADAVERLFGTPHRVRIESLAAAYGWEYLAVDQMDGLRRVLGSTGPRRRLIEVVVRRSGLRALHAEITEAVNALEWPESR
ncbi:2-succinyl-5-enolpyruvyl-6-hydroxy-3-cyclohexene-1-carboxylic-acid synthase [Paeniglutamicibacter kerguelensis]|uniref:2-succinyl-5-enolpyruvyl-6-hydroxy-3-cyclohexene-1-carboxylate synthase n=1 Tax=Paeniglutamicibacter kerguelensis TaxID=254788 RepID=A0ABS4XEX5_9MICC|nr:2-succinyl-5-enolpyruvyl-6-hydroxy-3-cyclohexene-1-carboxylic-acid synthase [Paeniglutamicibacter kerguelensis]MBP2387022.1 2-succinyl-5-enolpyruvyl-6-hydroxy-3-cyclohexene-1-carboxylate synthase [Paeniglutamicibacter kerguelensis]